MGRRAGTRFSVECGFPGTFRRSPEGYPLKQKILFAKILANGSGVTPKAGKAGDPRRPPSLRRRGAWARAAATARGERAGRRAPSKRPAGAGLERGDGDPPLKEGEAAAGEDHGEDEGRAAHRGREDGVGLPRPGGGVRAEGGRGPLVGIPRPPRQQGGRGPQGPADPVGGAPERRQEALHGPLERGGVAAGVYREVLERWQERDPARAGGPA